jgi:hypothetical protein
MILYNLVSWDVRVLHCLAALLQAQGFSVTLGWSDCDEMLEGCGAR